jgi:hypothetical protein
MSDTIDVDGVHLGPRTDYLALVREQLKDGCVWPSDTGPEEGLWHAFDAAEGTAIYHRLLDAIVRLVTDPDVEVRTRAIAMTHNYAPEIDPVALLSALRNHPKLYEGVKPRGVPESYMPDLAWGIIQTMNANPNGNPEVIAVLRKAVEDPTNGFRVLGGLAAADAAWLIDRATQLVSGQPVRVRIILGNLPGPAQREQFVRTLANQPAAFREELADVIGEKVENPDERQRLASILGLTLEIDPEEEEGIRLGPSTDYVALLRRQLRNGSVWNEVGDSGPEDGFDRTFEAASTPIRKGLVDALTKLLTDADEEVRSRAVGLAQLYAEEMDPVKLLQVLERNLPLFEGVRPPESPADDPDLAWGLIHAMTANTGHDSRVLARLKRAAFDTEHGSSVLGGLAADDPEWIIAQARHMVSQDPMKARIIIGNLPGEPSRERFVTALAGEPSSFRKQLLHVIADKVKDPAERERLKSLLA